MLLLLLMVSEKLHKFKFIFVDQFYSFWAYEKGYYERLDSYVSITQVKLPN
jgi:hypothetical protein